MAGQFTESPHVDRANLLDEHAGRLAGDIGPGTKRRGTGATRGRRDEYDGAREHLVCVHDDAEGIRRCSWPTPRGSLNR
jgi:hypothetical protein